MSREFKVGDRVRVTLEGTVESLSDRDLCVGRGWAEQSIIARHPNEHTITIEKIEPPVEVFKPGDVVRHKKHRSFRYTLGGGGYFSHQLLTWVSSATQFTSEDYELVILVEPPL